MGDTSLLLRVVAAGALVGFLVFCIAHVIVVWRKRNAKKNGSGPVKHPARKLAFGCVITGVVLLPIAAVHRELTRGEASLTGEGLYILRAQDDLNVEWLRESGVTGAGEVLARFGSGSRTARSYELQARLARAEAERDVLDLLPLSPDPELTRRYQVATQERTQAQQELGQAVIAVEVAGRDLTSQLFNRKESLTRLELTLTERRKELDRVTLKSTHASQLLSQYQTLGGSVSANEVRDLIKASRDAEIEVASVTQEIKNLLAEKMELRTHLDKLEMGRSDPSAPLRKQVTTLTARVARLETEEAELKAKIETDLARSNKLRSAEKVQAVAKVREHQAAVDSLSREREVLAPFAGTLAYRATSPNATKSRGTLAVLAPEEGFLLTARLNESDAEAIRNGAEVTIEMGDDSPERRLPARFFKMTPLAYEPGFSAVQLACQPPPEMVRRLAEGDKLTVPFTWHPPLKAMWPFRTGLLLFIVGLIGLVLTRKQSLKQSKPTTELRVRDRSSELARIMVGRLMVVRNMNAAEDLQDPSDDVEVIYRDSVAELQQTTNQHMTTGILARIRQYLWLRRTGHSTHEKDQFGQLRQILVAHKTVVPHSNPMKQLPSARN